MAMGRMKDKLQQKERNLPPSFCILTPLAKKTHQSFGTFGFSS